MAIVMFLLTVFIGVCWWRIAARAGYSPWLGLLILVPMVNLGWLAYFAFAEWPRDQQAPISNQGSNQGSDQDGD